MFGPRRILLVLVVAIAVIMLVPSPVTARPAGTGGAADGAAAIGTAGTEASGGATPAATAGTVSPASAASTTTPASSLQAQADSAVSRMSAAETRAGVPADRQLLPTLNTETRVQNGIVTPTPNGVPSPMGIADYGIQNDGGVNVATQTYYQSIEGSMTMNQLSLLYLDSAGPDEYTAQLNSVATGVTLFGDSTYQMWTQDVYYYQQGTHTLNLADAIVNFTSVDFNFSPNTVISGNGFYDPGFGYFYPYGPSIYAPEPFTIHFYTNLTTIDGDSAVEFGYVVASSAGVSGGTFDTVVFNSQPVSGPAISAPTPLFEISGDVLSGTGYIPLDAELILGGDGGGSTSLIFNIDATMQLYLEAPDSSAYLPVPAAYSFGGETGETVTGIAEWASGGADPTVHLGPGPADLEPLYGVAGAPGFGEVTEQLKVSPANAFVFGSTGASFDANTAAWSPVPSSGTAVYELPPGTYSYEVLLSEYAPQTHTLAGSGSVTAHLGADPALGVYTPLWAFGNGQLAAISRAGGTGSVGNPYVLENNEYGALNPLFGQFNDYLFPQFPGIFLVDTTAYVAVVQAPSLTVPLSLSWEVGYNSILPSTQQLGVDFYGTDHASLVDSSDLSGWVFAEASLESQSSVVLWNTTNTLVAGNTFQVESIGLFLFGGTQNTIWGNVFEVTEPVAPVPGYILFYGEGLGLYLFESGDLIFNNAFVTAITAYVPAYNVYSFDGVPEVWVDAWDVHPQPASAVDVVNGWRLSGSILGLSYVAGNYWWNYGTPGDPYGVLPYNNEGYIDYGGDYFPVVPFPLYTITFVEFGLPHGSSWSVTLDGYTQTTTGGALTFLDPTGAYPFSVASSSSDTAHPASGTVTVSHSSVVVLVLWS